MSCSEGFRFQFFSVEVKPIFREVALILPGDAYRAHLRVDPQKGWCAHGKAGTIWNRFI